MESRGTFRKNRTALNTGVYFQRSEILIEDNLIFDHFLLVETKAGLKPCVVKNNVIWGDFTKTTEATVVDNSIKDAVPDNDDDPPLIAADETVLMPDAVFSHRLGVTTELFLSNGVLKKGELVNRVVRAGNKWGVVKSTDEHHVEIWGDLSGEVFFSVLPSYRLR